MKFTCCQDKEASSDIKQAIRFLKIISEENRLKILCALRRRDLCVCEIWQHLGVPQNLASHHLKVLKNFGLLRSRKENTKVIYSLNTENIKKHYSLLSHYINN